MADFQHAYMLLKAGFQHINVAEIEQGIQSFADGVREIAVALKDCNVTQCTKKKYFVTITNSGY